MTNENTGAASGLTTAASSRLRKLWSWLWYYVLSAALGVWLFLDYGNWQLFVLYLMMVVIAAAHEKLADIRKELIEIISENIEVSHD